MRADNKRNYIKPAMMVYAMMPESMLLSTSIEIDSKKDYDEEEVDQRSMGRSWDEE